MKSIRILVVALLSLVSLSAPAGAQDRMSRIASSFENHNTEKQSISIWNGGYDKNICEFSIGYVNKSWLCTYDSGTQREDFFGDPYDKFLHGIQFGGMFTPSFDWGLGLRTGLFFESYVSRSKWVTFWCNHFTELDMYIPLQASYRIPVTDDISFNLFGGVGFQWAMSGRYYRRVGTGWQWWGRHPIIVPFYQTMKHEYGNGWPQKVNWQADCGFNFCVKHFVIGFTYSFGLVDHRIENSFDDGQTYVPASKSRQDKMQVSVGFAF